MYQPPWDPAGVPAPPPGAVRSLARPVVSPVVLVLGVVALLMIATVVVGGVLVFGDRAPGPQAPAAASTTSAAAAPAPAATPAAPPAATPGADTGTVTFAAAGDVILGDAPSGQLPPNDGKDFFAQVREALQADVVTANLESPLSNSTSYVKCSRQAPGPSSSPITYDQQNCYAFRVPPAYGSVLRDGGFTVINLANNHSYDYGPDGYKQTVDALNSVGIKPTGGVAQVTVVEVRGVKVAVLGFSPYGDYSASVLNIDAASALVKQAASSADLVVVEMHVGAEGADQTHVKPGSETFLGENRGDSMKFAHAVIDAGADLVIGHGPHVMRAMEFYQGRLIAYSMGNFAGYRVVATGGVLGVSGVLKATLRRDGSYVSGTLIPTRLTDVGLPATDPNQQALAQIRTLCTTDLPTTGAKIGDTGAITPR